MLTANRDVELVKTKWGFYQVKNMPQEEELNRYYTEKYYQNGLGSYKVSYDEKELKHKVFCNALIAAKAISLNKDAKTFYDIGCGEGFLVNEFYKRGFSVHSCDFANAINNFFPNLAKFHKQGDIYEILKNDFGEEKSDIISTLNVLEHVTDPISFIENIKRGMHKDTILIITVPNDFSALQKYLHNINQTTERWICYPDHLNYFNTESLKTFLEDFGMEIVGKLISFPNEIFLLNDTLNYDKDPSKGPLSYSIIRDFDLYLSTLDIDKALKLYECFCEIGLGRNLTYYCKLR